MTSSANSRPTTRMRFRLIFERATPTATSERWKQSDDGTNANAQTVFSINITNGNQQQPNTGHQITINSLPQPEEEP